ncbi:hypothetical protein OEZ85_013084 [Tetradesmus obliquus]|uniref:Uncharacterized protein n=1 Tax=Tetradesmus obliquus TaxID=3088 RepID=A0ABY8U4K9_TETOB|nr:hypothetical protein OEZ85_013084 [Tetradesmus obliquus]
MQAISATRSAARPVAPARRASVKCNAQVRAVPRRQVLAGIAAAAAALLSAAAAQAAGESSATRAITAVNRPQQMKKKADNRAQLKEQVEKVKTGEADPRSLP